MKDKFGLLRELEELKALHLYRERRLAQGLKVFCSNDYLGLKGHPEVLEEAQRVLRSCGLGSGASQLVSGYTKYHRRLEEKLAGFKGTPCCVLFGSGYLANLGTIGALLSERDAVFSDELNHASIVDACRLSKANRFVYKHLDYLHLEELLKKHRKGYRRCLIVSDSVFSMDGDVADVRVLKRLAEDYECMLMLDEAHATGTVGETGRGSLELFRERWEDYIILMGSLSKALGAYGAFICGSQPLCEYLINKARSLIFSTSLPPSVCAGAQKAVEVLEREPQRVSWLRRMEERLVNMLGGSGYEVLYHLTPILPMITHSESRALELSKGFLEKGIFIQAIRYPAVPKGKARLRLTASLSYTEEDLFALERALKSFVIIKPCAEKTHQASHG